MYGKDLTKMEAVLVVFYKMGLLLKKQVATQHKFKFHLVKT
jgi:hypothetical protein